MTETTTTDAFDAVIAPHRRELFVHCYRMLGSLQDAEDVLQETLLSAWQGFGGFEARSSVRTWLYRIATNRCLNARRAAQRRPAREWSVPGMQPPEPTSLGEVLWLEPLPDDRLDAAVVSPDARYEQKESISLAFITALQLLPPRQVAVLVLRDVLGFRAAEVAGMLDTTVVSVNSALKRARAGLQVLHSAPQVPSPPAGSPVEDALVAQFTQAYESADIDALIAMFTDDVFMSMPPVALEYEGREPVGQFLALLFGARRYHLVATRANGQPAFGSYVRGPDGGRHSSGLFVVTLAGDRVSSLIRFENTMFPWFGLPRTLP